MTDRELMQKALEALNRSDYLGWQLNIPIIKALRERLAQPEQEPFSATVWVEPDFWEHCNRVNCGTAYRLPAPGRHPLYTSPPRRKPDYKEFMEWASSKGYDTAYAINSDNGKYIPLNPMAADLWKAWQAAHGIKD